MSSVAIIACVLALWALLSLIGSDCAARRQTVESAAAAAVAKRRADAAKADAAAD